MSHLPKEFQIDLLQLLNGEMAARAPDFSVIADGAWYIHSPKPFTYEVRNTEAGVMGVFSLQELPGCCGVLVSHFSEVAIGYRKKGLGELLLDIRMGAARRQGYGQMLATVLDDNVPERKLLDGRGWRAVGEFRNPKTQHIVVNYIVNL